MKKYELVEQTLKGQMETGEIAPGEKLPSEQELCRRFGVSRSAVRQALKNLAHQGCAESVKGVGTFCRLRPENGRLTANIGFIGFFSHSYIFPRIIQGIDSVLYREGFHLLIGQSLYRLERERSILQSYIDKPVDGIILEPVCDGNPEYSNRSLVEEAIDRGIPVVFIDNTIPGIETASVSLDDFSTGYAAVSHLIEKGHRRIGLFYQEDYYTKLQRTAGARACISEHGERNIRFWESSFRGQGEHSTAKRQAEAFLASAGREITALMCTSDEDAIVCIEAAEAMGLRIPEDISVIGFDDWEASSLQRIGLTSFEHPGRTMGGMIARSLIDEIKGESRLVSASMVLRPRLVERTSVLDISS